MSTGIKTFLNLPKIPQEKWILYPAAQPLQQQHIRVENPRVLPHRLRQNPAKCYKNDKGLSPPTPCISSLPFLTRPHLRVFFITTSDLYCLKRVLLLCLTYLKPLDHFSPACLNFLHASTILSLSLSVIPRTFHSLGFRSWINSSSSTCNFQIFTVISSLLVFILIKFESGSVCTHYTLGAAVTV